ncbi:MAG TPA: ABC transporter ATP-binding protein [Ktedonobacterales bacterium]|jgi:ABC-2 type transport system ATP-binding protein
MIRAVGLTKHFGTTVAVEGLDLEIAEGEAFGLLGPKRAGKTTTIRMLSTLMAPTGGEAWIGDLQVGVNEATNALIRRNIGVLPEVPGLYERLSAEQNLRIFAGLSGLRNGPTRVKHSLQMVGLWDQRNTPVSSFSRGMKQKLSLARALLHNPRVLLLDEPTHGLDRESAQVVRDTIQQLRSEGLTILLCTNNHVEADYLCDVIAVFHRQLIHVDTPEHLRQELWEPPQITFRMRGRAGPYQHLLSELPFVRDVASSEDSLLAALTSGAEKHEAIAAMVRRLVEAGADLFEVGELTYSLEDAYLVLLEGDAGAQIPPEPARLEQSTPPPTGSKSGGRQRG